MNVQRGSGKGRKEQSETHHTQHHRASLTSVVNAHASHIKRPVLSRWEVHCKVVAVVGIARTLAWIMPYFTNGSARLRGVSDPQR